MNYFNKNRVIYVWHAGILPISSYALAIKLFILMRSDIFADQYITLHIILHMCNTNKYVMVMLKRNKCVACDNNNILRICESGF